MKIIIHITGVRWLTWIWLSVNHFVLWNCTDTVATELVYTMITLCNKSPVLFQHAFTSACSITRMITIEHNINCGTFSSDYKHACIHSLVPVVRMCFWIETGSILSYVHFSSFKLTFSSFLCMYYIYLFILLECSFYVTMCHLRHKNWFFWWFTYSTNVELPVTWY